MSTKRCLVSVIDHGGMRHSVEVHADSLYEAAVRGLRLLRDHGWVPHTQLSRSRMDIAVSEPTKRHTIRLDRLESWIESSGAVGPKEFLKRRALRDLLHPTRTRL